MKSLLLSRISRAGSEKEQMFVYSVTNPVILPIAMLDHNARKGLFYIIEIYFKRIIWFKTNSKPIALKSHQTYLKVTENPVASLMFIFPYGTKLRELCPPCSKLTWARRQTEQDRKIFTIRTFKKQWLLTTQLWTEDRKQ